MYVTDSFQYVIKYTCTVDVIAIADIWSVYFWLLSRQIFQPHTQPLLTAARHQHSRHRHGAGQGRQESAGALSKFLYSELYRVSVWCANFV